MAVLTTLLSQMWASVSQAVSICLELWNRTQSAECTCMFKIKTLVESHETTSLFQKLYWLTTNLILKYSWVITCFNTCVLLKKFWNCHIQLYYSILCHIPHFMKRGSNTSDLFPIEIGTYYEYDILMMQISKLRGATAELRNGGGS